MRFTAILAALAVTATAAPLSSASLQEVGAALGKEPSFRLIHCICDDLMIQRFD